MYTQTKSRFFPEPLVRATTIPNVQPSHQCHQRPATTRYHEMWSKERAFRQMLHSLTGRQGHYNEHSIKERNFDSNTSGLRYSVNNAFRDPLYTTWDPESPLHKFRDLWQPEAPSPGYNGSKDSQPSTPRTTSPAELYDEGDDLADICREGRLEFVGNWIESEPIAVAVARESIRDDNDEIYTPVGSPRSSPRQIDGLCWPPSPSASST